jgi:hypothetical protein
VQDAAGEGQKSEVGSRAAADLAAQSGLIVSTVSINGKVKTLSLLPISEPELIQPCESTIPAKSCFSTGV